MVKVNCNCFADLNIIKEWGCFAIQILKPQRTQRKVEVKSKRKKAKDGFHTKSQRAQRKEKREI